MERWQFIKLGIAASVVAHLLVVALIFVSTEVRTYESPASEPIDVDVVDAEPTPQPTPQATPEPKAELKPSFTPPAPAASPSPVATPAAAQQPSAAPAPREAKAEPRPEPKPESQPQPQVKPEPQPRPQPTPQAQQPVPPQPPAPQPSLGYTPAQPDLTVMYGVALGLPEPLAPRPPGDKPDEEGGGGPSATKSLASEMVGALRRHLKSCARLPAGLKPSDNVSVRLRLRMAPDGRLASEPELIEAPPDAKKGIVLVQGAINAITACQPYAMLPADRYGDWRMLELSITPQDFAG